MQTIDPISPDLAPPRGRGRRLVAVTCISVVLFIALAGGLWLGNRAPSPDAAPGRVARYMASEAFAALSEIRKAPYLDAFQRAKRRGDLTPDELSGVLSNVEMGGERDPFARYFSLPAGRERERFLDDVIDRATKADKLHPPTPPRSEGEKSTEFRVNGGQFDAQPPQDRARMTQFMQDVHDRRLARGLPDDGRFLFPRPE